MTGVAVAGLMLVAIGAMHGMGDVIAAHPARAAFYLGLAFTINLAFQAVGTALFYRFDRIRSLTIGLVSGNRNVTLIWAAVGADLLNQPGVELYLAMSVFPIFMLPTIQSKIMPFILSKGAPACGYENEHDVAPELLSAHQANNIAASQPR